MLNAKYFIKYNETIVIFQNSNISSLPNLQGTVTNKKCKKVYTNGIITR